MDCVLEPGFDQATADLIIQLQLEDIGLHAQYSKGKSGDPTDEELAFQLQNVDLESMSQLLFDRRMAMSFATAVQSDAQILVPRFWLTARWKRITSPKTAISLFIGQKMLDVLSLRTISSRTQNHLP